MKFVDMQLDDILEVDKMGRFSGDHKGKKYQWTAFLPSTHCKK